MGETPLKRLILALAVLLTSSHFALGQAVPTATRRGALQAGVDFVADYPDYTNSKYYGYGAFVDLDLWEHFGAEFNFRQANDITTKLNNTGSQELSARSGHVPSYERSFEIGARYYRQYKRYNPYVRASIGRGDFEYPPLPPPSDQSVSQGTLGYYLVSGATGLDYSISQHFTVRADFEYQRWFNGTTSPGSSPNNINGLPRGLTPILYSGGIAYRFGYGNNLP